MGSIETPFRFVNERGGYARLICPSLALPRRSPGATPGVAVRCHDLPIRFACADDYASSPSAMLFDPTQRACKILLVLATLSAFSIHESAQLPEIIVKLNALFPSTLRCSGVGKSVLRAPWGEGKARRVSLLDAEPHPECGAGTGTPTAPPSMKLCRFVMLAALLTAPLRAQQPDTLQYRIPASGSPVPVAGDNLGRSVGVSGSLMVVGVPGDDTGASAAGSVYVYDLSSATPTMPWVMLHNPSPAGGDLFGQSAAISGTRVVVGAKTDESGMRDVGKVYVYDLASEAPTVPVVVLNNPTPAQYDFFGDAVAISGRWVVVGAHEDDTGASNTGCAYLYDLASETPALPVQTLTNPTLQVLDKFGIAVAISGTRVVVGAPWEDTGAGAAGSAYVYDLSNGTPAMLVATLHNPSPQSGDCFGQAVAVSGTHVVVGAWLDETGASNAGSAYVYELSDGSPTLVATLNNPSPAADDLFGLPVAISGWHVVVGAIRDDTGASNTGSVYIYDLASATPSTPVATLNNPDPALDDGFGSSVAIDAMTVAIGTPDDDSLLAGQGSVHVFGQAPDIQVEAPLGMVRVSGGSPLNFGLQSVEGALIIGVTHRVTNTGLGNLTGLVATIVGAAADDFTLSALPPATLAPGVSFQFEVRFDPRELGARMATLSLASNDPDEIPFLVPLQGTGLTAQEAWRMQYLLTTENRGDAADTADPDGDGDENLFEFVAGLVPNDAGSRFRVRVEPVVEEPGQKAIVFGPVIAGRTYEVKSKGSLDDPTWEPLESFTMTGEGAERTVIDRSPGEGPRFYIVEIIRP